MKLRQLVTISNANQYKPQTLLKILMMDEGVTSVNPEHMRGMIRIRMQGLFEQALSTSFIALSRSF